MAVGPRRTVPPPEERFRKAGILMTQQTADTAGRTRTWHLSLDIFEEDEDTTTVHAVLDTGDNQLVSRTTAHRNPHDRPVPEIGDEYAAGRALLALGRDLLEAGAADADANASADADGRA
jgi:hypothetical protein